jgi:hypothetical protein
MVKMKLYSTISSKGQVTVPQEVVMEADRTVIRPAREEANPFEKFIGITGPFPGGEEGIKAWIDDMRSDKDYE